MAVATSVATLTGKGSGLDRSPTIRDEDPMHQCRTAHYIDIENLLGTDRSPEGVRRCWSIYRAGVGVRPGDAVVVASGPKLARIAAFELRNENISYHVRSGIDGADLALLDLADPAHTAARYGAVIIASGDGAFTPLALAARTHGMPVRLVLGRGLPSRRLVAACSYRTRLILDPAQPRPVAA